MKKILLLASITLFLIQCKKKVELPELAKDNDYAFFDLKDRVCEINQKITILEKSNFTIEEQNATYIFNSFGYLVTDSIYNNENVLIETNTFEKLKFPLTKKQFISPDNYILSETLYDSVKNIAHFKKSTPNKQIIEEQRNTLSDDYIVREDYYTSGSATPSKVVKIVRNGDVMKSKVILSQTRKILDSIVYVYDKKNIIKETHYNANKQTTSTQLFTYEGKNIASVVYLDASGKEEAVEEFKYNQNNDLTYKYSFTVSDNSTYEEQNVYNKNNKIEKSETKLNGTVLISTTYKYDDNNNIVSYTVNNFNNKENFSKTFVYTFDEKGNWISKEVSFNKVPTYKVSRTIKYCNE